MQKLLHFVAIGPHKTGTTWIYDYLTNYRQVALPTKLKESFFFDEKFDRGIDWYYSHFSSYEEVRKFGEIAPSYFHSLEAPQRIYQHNPQCKIIVTLREPVSRLISFYLHMKQRGEIKPGVSFLSALSQKQILRDAARYHFHLSRWIDIFGADRVQVIFFEELAKSPMDFAQQLCKKLDLELENTTQNLSEKVNASKAPINYPLSLIVYRSVNLLHDLGLHKVVGYGKKLGVKKILNREISECVQLSQSDFNSTFSIFKRDIMMLESDLNLDLSTWKKLWLEQGIKS